MCLLCLFVASIFIWDKRAWDRVNSRCVTEVSAVQAFIHEQELRDRVETWLGSVAFNPKCEWTWFSQTVFLGSLGSVILIRVWAIGLGSKIQSLPF